MRNDTTMRVSPTAGLMCFMAIWACMILQVKADVTLSSVEPYGFLPRTEGQPMVLGDTVQVKLAQSECEPGVIVFDNTGEDAKNIEFQAFYKAGKETPLPAEAVSLERIVHLPAREGGESYDQLLPLADVDVVGCPAGERRYLWLTVNSRGLDPGAYRGTVHIRILSPMPKRLESPVAVTVWPFSIPERAPIGVFTWDCQHATLYSDDYLANFVEHKANHWMTTLYGKPGAVPPLKPDGSLSHDPDFSSLTPMIRRGKPYGSFMFTVWGQFGGAYSNGAKDGNPWPGSNTPYMSPEWRIGFTQWFKAFIAYLDSQDLDYSDWLWYPFDELLNDAFLAHATLVKEIDPNVRIFADTSTDDPEEVKVWAPLIDIWCPLYHSLVPGKEETPKNTAYRALKDAGETIWCYWEGLNMRTISPTLRYRSSGWLAWEYGLGGVMFWNSVVNQGDRWTDMDGTNGEMATVFPIAHGYANTRRWEAWRDGVEDYQYLHLLRQLAEKAGPDLRQEALSLIETSTDAMLVEVTEAFEKGKGRDHRHDLMHQFTPAMAKEEPEKAEQAVWTPEVPGRARKIREQLAEMIAELRNE